MSSQVSTLRGFALRPRHVLPTLCAVGVLCGSVAGQQQTPFKSGASTVAVYTTVTDSTGRLVPDLTKDDFEIYDNGKLQPLTLFATETQPITVVVMLDRSGSMKTQFHIVEEAAAEFITRLLKADKVRIGSFAARIQVDPQDFTSDKREMLMILSTELQPDGPTPLWNAVQVSINALRRQDGRRVTLVFTDGVDAPMNFSSNNVSLKDAIKRAQEDDVMVYAIGLEGRVPYGNRRAPVGGLGGGYFGQRNMISQKPDEGLAKIAGETGGGYIELSNANDLKSSFARVADELHRQYLLGFAPAKLDGKTHKLEVKLKQPGMTARARKSYVAKAES